MRPPKKHRRRANFYARAANRTYRWVFIGLLSGSNHTTHIARPRYHRRLVPAIFPKACPP